MRIASQGAIATNTPEYCTRPLIELLEQTREVMGEALIDLREAAPALSPLRRREQMAAAVSRS